MKKAIITTLLALLTLVSYGAETEPLKFLGIPVDGTEAQFIYKLKSKGFTYDSYRGFYKGQFNGSKVEVGIHSYHGLVDRVYVLFPETTERNIKGQYNRLLWQFQDLGKYAELLPNEAISEDEDVSYEITVNNKRYEASFQYFDPNREKEFQEKLIDRFSDMLTEEQLAKVKESVGQSTQSTLDSLITTTIQTLSIFQDLGLNKENTDLIHKAHINRVLYEASELADGDVWFYINEKSGRYRIVLYYDNKHNKAKGEDL